MMTLEDIIDESYRSGSAPQLGKLHLYSSKTTTAQVVETSVTVNNNNNSPIQDYVHPDDQTQPTFEMTPVFKPFTVILFIFVKVWN